MLEWTVECHHLLTGRDQDRERGNQDTWGNSLVSLLRDLSPADLGVPHAEAALDRVRRATEVPRFDRPAGD